MSEDEEQSPRRRRESAKRSRTDVYSYEPRVATPPPPPPRRPPSRFEPKPGSIDTIARPVDFRRLGLKISVVLFDDYQKSSDLIPMSMVKNMRPKTLVYDHLFPCKEAARVLMKKGARASLMHDSPPNQARLESFLVSDLEQMLQNRISGAAWVYFVNFLNNTRPGVNIVVIGIPRSNIEFLKLIEESGGNILDGESRTFHEQLGDSFR